eukprot:m.192127 g.192127  ORF g.192127 m.192127 type:complete len:631 (+) comp18260_c0_seq4:102-1994(+)
MALRVAWQSVAGRQVRGLCADIGHRLVSGQATQRPALPRLNNMFISSNSNSATTMAQPQWAWRHVCRSQRCCNRSFKAAARPGPGPGPFRHFAWGVPAPIKPIVCPWRKRLKQAFFAGVVVWGVGLSAVLAYFPIPPETPKLEQCRIFVGASWRFLVDVICLARMITDYMWVQRQCRGKSAAEAEDAWHQAHMRNAIRLRDACCANQGIYVKLGQHLGQLDYLVPVEYISAMEIMFDKAPTSAFEDIEATFREEFNGLGPDDVFESFERVPIASASLAQVHRARTKSGQLVAVKIQHRRLRENCTGDVATVDLLVTFVKWAFPHLDYTWLTEEMRLNVPLELDFLHEAANAKRCARMFAHRDDITVPEVFDELTTHRVLCLGFEKGITVTQANEIENMELNPSDVARLISQVFAEQIFVHGFVHCDPHPGNILIRPHPRNPRKPQIVVLDHGLYRELDDDFRVNYCRLWRALINADVKEIERYCAKLNAGDMYPLFAAMLTKKSWNDIITPDANHLKLRGTDEEKALIRKNAELYAHEISRLLSRVPRDLLLVMKTNDCLYALDQHLGAPVNTHLAMARCCMRGIHAHEAKKAPGWIAASQRFVQLAWLEVRLWVVETLAEWVSEWRRWY